jgi:hypothetical protein
MTSKDNRSIFRKKHQVKREKNVGENSGQHIYNQKKDKTENKDRFHHAQFYVAPFIL